MLAINGDQSWPLKPVDVSCQDREKQPGLMTLLKKMISIPFELNKKPRPPESLHPIFTRRGLPGIVRCSYNSPPNFARLPWGGEIAAFAEVQSLPSGIFQLPDCRLPDQRLLQEAHSQTAL